MEKMELDNSLFGNSQCKNDGTIDACKECSGIECCGIVKEEGVIEPPYLTKHDITQIECSTGLKKEIFAVERMNPITGNMVFILKTIENKGCMFFDRNKGKCKIFSFRPIDCRLFPLDCRQLPSNINKSQNHYYWALFKFKRCSLKRKDVLSLLRYKDDVTKILGNEIHDFATYPLPEMEKIGYKKIEKVNLLQGE